MIATHRWTAHALRHLVHRRMRLSLAALVALAAVPLVPTISVRADAGGSFPGGCYVVVEATALNNTCTIVNLASDPETLVYQGAGTVTVTTVAPTSACPSTLWSASAPGTYTLTNELGGCSYTVSISNGVAVAADQNMAGTGYCAQLSIPTTPPAPTVAQCNHVALATSGVAIGMAASSAPITYTLSVVDQTRSPFVTVATCSASGFGVLTQQCPFAEQAGHIYYETTSISSGTAVAVGVAGVG
ncbi:MAG TPA: hypothetical protein VGQ42_04510 [Candidatus Dormibacteraeota bacterium]|jgi:hypothetical protein|nr:hypothetical protein [Candidatus Dormibacteraeota bacterium]